MATASFWLALGRERLTLEPVHRSLREKFDMAPPALMFAAGTGPPRAPLGASPLYPRPVILVIVDALRPARMGIYDARRNTTPFLSSLRDAGILQRIDRAYGGCSFSLCGVLGILTSRTWDDFGTWPPTIMDVMAAYRYRSYLILSGSHARFGNLRRLYGPNIAVLSDETMSPTHPPDNDPAMLDRLERMRFADSTHSFIYLHLMSPQAGSYLLPRYRQIGSTGRAVSSQSMFDIPRGPHRYDMGVRQADDMIRRVFVILNRKAF